MKNAIIFFLCALSFLDSVEAQINFNDTLPTDPKLIYGKLDNGFTYYIYPMPGVGAANIKLITKVGSIDEEENERGFAHFLEHMAFAGTKNYPGDSAINLIRSFGLNLGSDFNAATNFEYTEFDIKNIDMRSERMFDQSLLIARDWSCNLTLAAQSVEKERGIIEEEWRTGNNYAERMADSLCSVFFAGSIYAKRFPIGSMDIIRHFQPSQLRAFYHKWYRPNLQAIFIVGDFTNPKAVQQQVKDLFESIGNPQNGPTRKSNKIADHQGIRYLKFIDPEATSTDVGIFFPHDRLPSLVFNTKEAYRTMAVQSLVNAMMNSRFSDIASLPDSPFLYSQCTDEKYLVAASKEALGIVALSKEGKAHDTFKTLMTEIRRAYLHGFSCTEMGRARSFLNSYIDNQLKEKENLKRNDYIDIFVDHFLNGGDLMSFADSFALLKDVVNNHVTLEDAWKFLKNRVETNNVDISISGAPGASIHYPDEQEIGQDYTSIMASMQEKYQDTVASVQWFDEEPKPGKIVEEKIDSTEQITMLLLSNGMKVLLKHTSFKNDEILLNGYSEGGFNLYGNKHVVALKAMNDVIEGSALGNYDHNMLNKQLAGSNISLVFNISSNQETFKGNSSKRDFETLMRVLYLYFTDVRKDVNSLENVKGGFKLRDTQLKNNPDVMFSEAINKNIYPHYPYFSTLSEAEINAIDYDEVLQLYRERVSNPGDYTFSIIGNYNEDSVKYYIEKYMASIPDNAKRESSREAVEHNSGVHYNNFKVPMTTIKSSVDVELFGELPFSVENFVFINMLQQATDNILNSRIREKESSTYGATIYADLNEFGSQWLLSCKFDTNTQSTDRLLENAIEEINLILSNGIPSDEFNKLYNQQLNSFSYVINSNNFWAFDLYLYSKGINYVKDFYTCLYNMTYEKFNDFLKSLKIKDKIITIMEGVEK